MKKLVLLVAMCVMALPSSAAMNFYKNAKEAASNKEPESESPFTNSRVSRTALPAKGSYTNEERARNSERSKSRVNSWTINSDEAKKAASKGKDVVDEIIDVTPTDVSSKRYGKQK